MRKSPPEADNAQGWVCYIEQRGADVSSCNGKGVACKHTVGHMYKMTEGTDVLVDEMQPWVSQ